MALAEDVLGMISFSQQIHTSISLSYDHNGVSHVIHVNIICLHILQKSKIFYVKTLLLILLAKYHSGLKKQ